MDHHAAGHETNGHAHSKSFVVRVLRQDEPGKPSYWQRFTVDRESDMNVISVLQRIATMAITADGEKVAPVAWDCNCLEEVCGACTMVINGKVRQACSALVDRLLVDHPDEIELRPMTKFPVVRDLMVDRSRLFDALKKLKAWISVDGYYDAGPGPKQSPDEQQMRYPLSECMSCGCCLEACPQYQKIELTQRPSEADAEFAERKKQVHDQGFVGAHAISQVILFNSHPTGHMDAGERIDKLTEPGGVQVCGNAQNCVVICPKKIPLVDSIGRAGRAATVRTFTRWFGG
jgi:succinate dehydrogenase / fumarate reductase iron-sulfur subunit